MRPSRGSVDAERLGPGPGGPGPPGPRFQGFQAASRSSRSWQSIQCVQRAGAWILAASTTSVARVMHGSKPSKMACAKASAQDPGPETGYPAPSLGAEVSLRVLFLLLLGQGLEILGPRTLEAVRPNPVRSWSPGRSWARRASSVGGVGKAPKTRQSTPVPCEIRQVPLGP